MAYGERWLYGHDGRPRAKFYWGEGDPGCAVRCFSPRNDFYVADVLLLDGNVVDVAHSLGGTAVIAVNAVTRQRYVLPMSSIRAHGQQIKVKGRGPQYAISLSFAED